MISAHSPFIFILLVAAAAAFRPDPIKRPFEHIDADGDGQIDDIETDAHLEHMFEREVAAFMEHFDANQDGQVAQDEYTAKANKFFTSDRQTANWFWDSIDRDKDSFTNPEEMHNERSLVLTATAQELARQWGRKHDINSDTRISRDEYLSFEGNTEAKFLTIDRNSDGMISTKEYLQTAGTGGRPKIWIKHQDANEDGLVSANEYYKSHTEL